MYRNFLRPLASFLSALAVAVSCGEIAPPIPIDTPDPDTATVRRAAADTDDPEDAPEREIVGSGYW